ncbi:hypothetical protein BDV33DRAFT_182561 [Aspergillus novoparasiticus]|uniref:Uncharacterized protein n=1 Tax=Aspergillus novoparasiticus TaxID=986946 RepID=A0A5N6ECG6_9EURO|nr:hypothetical protein BDV33DRAFT_182561 [Aspergillus novoparasiticus]
MNNKFGYRGYEPELVRIELDFYRAFADLGLLRLFYFWSLLFGICAVLIHVSLFTFHFGRLFEVSGHMRLVELNRLLSHDCHSNLMFVVQFRSWMFLAFV